jgi:hypothetical protein
MPFAPFEAWISPRSPARLVEGAMSRHIKALQEIERPSWTASGEFQGLLRNRTASGFYTQCQGLSSARLAGRGGTTVPGAHRQRLP